MHVHMHVQHHLNVPQTSSYCSSVTDRSYAHVPELLVHLYMLRYFSFLYFCHVYVILHRQILILNMTKASRSDVCRSNPSKGWGDSDCSKQFFSTLVFIWCQSEGISPPTCCSNHPFKSWDDEDLRSCIKATYKTNKDYFEHWNLQSCSSRVAVNHNYPFSITTSYHSFTLWMISRASRLTKLLDAVSELLF